MRKHWVLVGFMTLVVALAAGLYVGQMPGQEAIAQVAAADGDLHDEQVTPDPPAAWATEAPALPEAAREALVRRQLEIRERAAEGAVPPGPPGLPHLRGAEAVFGDDAEVHGTPSDLVIGRNNQNTRANILFNNASTLAEPAAANNAARVFAAGNTHAEFSTNGGGSWTNVPVPAGPTIAPTPCCDNDIFVDDARRVTFWSLLYSGAGGTGVVRLYVIRNIGGAIACSYTFGASGFNEDYPHIGANNRFLFLMTNVLGGTPSQRARVRRMPIDSLVDCVAQTSITVNVFDVANTVFPALNGLGSRVFTPAEGTMLKESMWWYAHVNSTTVRIYRWDNPFLFPNSPVSFDRVVAASNFTNPDCRGGVGNFDFIERATSTGGRGFRHRAAVGHDRIAFSWPVGADSQHAQGHIHGAVFNLPSLSLIAQPSIFSGTECTGYPHVAANTRGHFAVSLAKGGRAGGGGTAAQGFVGMDDDFTFGHSWSSFTLTAIGTHNRSDSRYGDYFTIHAYEPCEKWFVATNYALNGGTSVLNVNSRYVEFGRRREFPCYNAHRFQQPTATLP